MSIKVAVCKRRLIDSLNFIPLADMPKAFGESKLIKDHFSHLFNRKENQHVILEYLPNSTFYTPNGMKPEARQTSRGMIGTKMLGSIVFVSCCGTVVQLLIYLENVA